MKRLTALLFLLPALVSAETLVATSGTATISFPGKTASFSFAGSDFSASGTMSFGPDVGPGLLTGPISPGPYNADVGAGYPDDGLGIGLTVNGVEWGLVPGADGSGADVEFVGRANLTGVGTFSGPFTLQGGFTGLPAGSGNPSTCSMCKTLDFSGAGTVTVTVAPYPMLSGYFEVEQETFTFRSVPEPSSLSLMAGGLAILGLYVGARRPRELLTPRG